MCSNKTISVAALIENKKIKRYIGKKTIRSRDESSYLSPSKGCEYIKIAGKKVAVVVGEDIHTEQEYGEYADLIINLCNSPYSRGIIEKRYDFYRQLAFMTGKSIVFVNNVGAQTDIVYDGPDQRNVRGAYYDARPRFRGTSVRCDRGKHAIAHPGHDDDGDIQ